MIHTVPHSDSDQPRFGESALAWFRAGDELAMRADYVIYESDPNRMGKAVAASGFLVACFLATMLSIGLFV